MEKMMIKYLFGTLFLIFVLAGTSFAAKVNFSMVPTTTEIAYYVDGSVASSGNGKSLATAFKKIQEAANVVTAGNIVLVYPGTYNERVGITRSGVSGNKITFRSMPRREATVNGGFQIDGRYIRVEGFSVTIGYKENAVEIKGDYADVVDNYFFNCAYKAIRGDMAKNTKSAYIANNHIYHSQSGIVVEGEGWLVENNEVERLYDYGNSDCDYSRGFGSNHVIRNNYFHGSLVNEIGSAHVDGFQFYNMGGDRYLRNMVFEGNIIKDFHQGFINEDPTQSHMSDITIRNNVFIGGELGNRNDGGGYGVFDQDGGVDGLNIIHNVFTNIGVVGVVSRIDVAGGVASTGIISNNIFYDMNGREFSHEAIDIETNNILKTQNLLFVNPNLPLGADGIPFTSDDGFNLRSGSPAINSGINVGVSTDILGNSRNGAPDAGAYEYVSP
jgi:hypothetical protein